MAVTLDPEIEQRLTARAADSGMTLSAYVTEIFTAFESLENEMDSYVQAGERSGDSIHATPDYWDSKLAGTRRRMSNG